MQWVELAGESDCRYKSLSSSGIVEQNITKYEFLISDIFFSCFIGPESAHWLCLSLMMMRIVLATVCCRFGSWGLIIKLNFCSDFEHKVLSTENYMILILTTICAGEDWDRHCAEDACGDRPSSSASSSLLFDMTLKVKALTNINGNMDDTGRDTSGWLNQQLLPKLHWLLISAQDCFLLDTRWKIVQLQNLILSQMRAHGHWSDFCPS